MPTHAFTISKLAHAGGVSVETIRYYQRRGLLDEPHRVANGFRAYDARHLQRLLFIKRAAELGFSLDDAAELTSLSHSPDRKRLRTIARARAADIRQRIAQLEAMAVALESLAATCQHTSPDQPCPIVRALHPHADELSAAAPPALAPSAPAACHGEARHGRRPIGGALDAHQLPSPTLSETSAMTPSGKAQ